MKLAPFTLAMIALLACAKKAPEPDAEAAPEAEASAPLAAQQAQVAIVPIATDIPAGEFKLDKSHASLVFKVDHIGFSNYTGQFDNFDATLQFNAAEPEKMSVVATIDAGSLDIPSPPEGFLDELKGPDWLDAGKFPALSFRSTKVTLTAPQTARIDGELTFHGVTAPVSMEARFNGGYANFPPYDPAPRIGFSATGSLNRSAFGVSAAIPNAEMKLGVGDLVKFEIDAEFTGAAPVATQ